MQRSGSEQERVIYYGQSHNPLLQSKLEIDQIGSHRSSRSCSACRAAVWRCKSAMELAGASKAYPQCRLYGPNSGVQGAIR